MIRVAYLPANEHYCILNGSNPNSVDTLPLSIDGKFLFDSKKELKNILKMHKLKIVRDYVVCA